MRKSRETGSDAGEPAREESTGAPGKATLSGLVQRRAADSAAPVATPALDRAAGGSGQPLPAATQERFRDGLGVDLGSVRMHSGDESAEAAADLHARAYTVGQDIHFGAGQLAPGSAEGDRLIAHEAVHTVQQRGAASGPQAKLEVSQPGDAAEAQADQIADTLMGGGSAGPVAASGPMVSRQVHVARDPLPTSLGMRGGGHDLGAGDVARDVVAAAERPVMDWLTANLEELRPQIQGGLTVEALAGQVRAGVPESARFGDGELGSMVERWAHEHGFIDIRHVPAHTGPRTLDTRSGPSHTWAQLRELVSAVASGVTLGPGGNGLRVGLNGAALVAHGGGGSVEAGVSLGGELHVSGSYGPAHFSATLGRDGSYSAGIYFGGDDAVPDAQRVIAVINRGGQAMGDMAHEVVTNGGRYAHLPPAQLVSALHPYLGPIGDAMSAVSGMGGSGLGVTLTGGAPPGGGPSVNPAGTSVVVTYTVPLGGGAAHQPARAPDSAQTIDDVVGANTPEVIARRVDGPEFETEVPGQGPSTDFDSDLAEKIRIMGNDMLAQAQRGSTSATVNLGRVPGPPSGFAAGLTRIVNALVAAAPQQLGRLTQVTCVANGHAVAIVHPAGAH